MLLGAALTWLLPLPRRHVLSLGRPRRGGLPYCGVHTPRRRCRVMSKICVGLPRHRGLPCAVVHPVRASGLASPHCCGMPCRSFRSPSSSGGVEPWRWATHAVVGSPRAAFASPRGRAVSDVSIGQPTSVWAALRLCSRCRGVWTSDCRGVGGGWGLYTSMLAEKERRKNTSHNESRGPHW